MVGRRLISGAVASAQNTELSPSALLRAGAAEGELIVSNRLVIGLKS
jgi:hypothetical protein